MAADKPAGKGLALCTMIIETGLLIFFYLPTSARSKTIERDEEPPKLGPLGR